VHEHDRRLGARVVAGIQVNGAVWDKVLPMLACAP
jgi:hypothetical protein